MQNDIVIAVDVAKAVLEVAVSDRLPRVRARSPRPRMLPALLPRPSGSDGGDGGLPLGTLLGT
jgi:hypothetical protein